MIGLVFILVKDVDKIVVLVDVVCDLVVMGFLLIVMGGIVDYFVGVGVEVVCVNKVYEGCLNIVDRLKNGEIVMVLNMIEGVQVIVDFCEIWVVVLNDKIFYFIIVVGSIVVVVVIKLCGEGEVGVCVLQV